MNSKSTYIEGASYFLIHHDQVTEVYRTRHSGYTIDHASPYRLDTDLIDLLRKGETVISFLAQDGALLNMWTWNDAMTKGSSTFRPGHPIDGEMIRYLWTQMDPTCKLKAVKAVVATHPKLGCRVIYFQDADGEGLGWRHFQDMGQTTIDPSWIQRQFALDDDLDMHSLSTVEVKKDIMLSSCTLF